MTVTLPVQYPATEKQINYLVKLLAEKIEDPAQALAAITWVQEHKLSKALASEKIKKYEKLPSVRKAFSSTPELEDGIYQVGADVFKVYRTRNGHIATKHLTEDGFEYTGQRPLKSIKPEHRMTKEKAAEYGALYNTCINCQRTLTDEVSIAQGFGPICAQYFA
jgi:hypothetical protein